MSESSTFSSRLQEISADTTHHLVSSSGGCGNDFQPIEIWFLACRRKDHGYAVYRLLPLEPQSLHDRTDAELSEPIFRRSYNIYVAIRHFTATTPQYTNQSDKLVRTPAHQQQECLAPVKLLTTIQNTTLHMHVLVRILDQ